MAGRPSRNTALLATILDHLPDALLLIDPAGAVVNANARALEVFKAPGATRPLIGRLVVDVLPNFGPAAERAGKSRHAAPSGARDTQRMTARALDGSTFPVDVFRALVPWAGSPDHLLLVLHEATSAPLESELVRTSQQAQAILRATEEAICGVDLNGKVVLANPAAGRLLATRLGDVAGKELPALAWHTKLDGTPYPAAETPIGQVLSTGKRISRQREVFWRSDGGPVPVEVSAVPIKDGETTVGAVAAITDVTRSVEEERRRNRLLAILDDEILTALTTLAESDLTDPKTVAGELERIRQIAADAVDYENLMANQVTVATRPGDVAPVLETAVESISALAAERQVTVNLATEPAAVASDPHRLSLAVGELLRAAVESSAPGASVALTVAAVGEKVRIGVRESKVADATQENPLLRWLRPHRGRQTGPDPDLAFVQVVVERHGGRFLLEPSTTGARGYVVELPSVTVPAAPAPLEEPPVEVSSVEVPVVEALALETPADIPAPSAEILQLRAQTNGPTREAGPVGSVIPMPTRSLRSVSASAETPAEPEPPAAPLGADPAVLVWPDAAAGLSGALSDRGAPAAGVSRVAQVGELNNPDASVLLVDPLAGPVSRKTLGELRAAANRASLPLVVVAGLTEAALEDSGVVLEPPSLLSALRAPGRSGAARVLVVEQDPALATALGAGLLKKGMQAVYAKNSDEAVLRAAVGPPEMVLLGLDTEAEGNPGILDWLVSAKLLVGTPVLVYTLDGMPPGYVSRLERGASLVGIGARGETPRTDDRLADLLVHIGSLAPRR
ncbi:PAS domain-containing protein [Sporichthya polymorpha]|uniref:PAS domain-containing protein n=1 Tax=Sporichthya polymorpha TaxID=35751 RepID=UPI0003AAAEBC|nr:PAS domain-containing protein [Sporichthya polymorpha]